MSTLNKDYSALEPRLSQYIIVQAGGKGGRLGHLTHNRPKCLVPVDNLPMIFHLFRQFPNAKFLVIGDTHFCVLQRYLAVFATVNYTLIRATGAEGTLAGISQAVALIPAGVPFMIVWSDLILPEHLEFPENPGNYIGLGIGVPCRWKFEHGIISEEPSSSHGIVGIFLLEHREIFQFPKSGQLVKFFSRHVGVFKQWPINGIREFGLLEEYEKLPIPICRSFNSLELQDDRVIKKPLTADGENLAKKEANWYAAVQNTCVAIPRVYAFAPLVLERIRGERLADVKDLSLRQKADIVVGLMAQLRQLHASGQAAYDETSYFGTYVDKTLARLEKVKALVPFAAEERININGMSCRNPLVHNGEMRELSVRYQPTQFAFIHGDCTFSNIMYEEDGRTVFIDPRGYFGDTLLYGDVAYDYAKLYYSLVGNYDSFNRKEFRLAINGEGARIYVASAGWENVQDIFYANLPESISKAQIRFFHALIWLGLTTYVWEDYDAVCGSFYMGALLFEEALREHNI